MKSTNWKRVALACLFLLGLWGGLRAQDTVRVMTYNMLRYGCQGISCTPVSVTARNTWLSSIMGATLPDILGVNEVGPSNATNSPAANLLLNVLRPLNPAYERTNVTFNGSQDVANGMFYNSDKVGFVMQTVIPEPTLTLRDINYYKFYYKGPGLALGDTTFIEVVQVHLHSSDENTRQVQTSDIMDYLAGLGRSGNFIVQGDLNLDGSTAGSFQNMVAHTNSNVKMNDVLNLTGNWHGATSARRAMTQATSTSPAPCGSGGSLDDRFDHILVSNSLLNGTQGIQAIASSYWVPGNTFSPNATVSSTVLNSLKSSSDHFPVVLDFAVNRAVATAPARPLQPQLRIHGNPASGHLEVSLDLQGSEAAVHELRLLGLGGQVVRSWPVAAGPGGQSLSLDAAGIAAGAYCLALVGDGATRAAARVVLLQP